MAKLKISIPYKKPLKTENSKSLLAGVVSVDITPPPGMPAAGYAMFSCICNGVRTKLKARIFYIKAKSDSPVVLVQCDLLSGSLLLHHKVAEMIADKTDVDSAAISICGTHTHSAPGNYYENKMYNDNASNKRGLEVNYLEFLSKQIADGIIEAYKNRKEAKIATGTTEIYGATINRSLAPYLLNENIKNLEKKPDALEAINPYIHMIRIDCKEEKGSYKPIGLFTTFSIHPNTSPVELGGLYNGDITGFVEREVENQIKKKYKTKVMPVHGAANYTHGDCNANHDQSRVENFKDLRELAKPIAKKTVELFYSLDNKLKSNIKVRYRTKELSLLQEQEIDGITICKRGFAGMSVAAGAKGRGRLTPFDKIFLFKPGRPRKFFTKGNQGHKKIIGSKFIQKMVLPAADMPHELMVQVIQIHDTVLIPLPWEITQEAGRRIEEKAKEFAEKSGLKDLKTFSIINTANGYAGYMNTPEEYSLQYYEGGSNYYGPNTAPFIAAQVGHITEQLAKEGSGSDMFSSFKALLPIKNYYPKKEDSRGIRQIEKNPEFNKMDDSDESYWDFKWYDVPLSEINFHEPLVKIEVSKDKKSWKKLSVNSIAVNDDGFDIAIINSNKKLKNGMNLYETRWYNPVNDNRYYRFSVLSRENHSEIHSAPFKS